MESKVTLIPADISTARFNRTSAGCSAPLASLSGGRLAQKFQSWQGISTRRYICSVFSAGDAAAMEMVTSYSDAVVLAVRRDASGLNSLVAIGDTGSLPELFWHGSALANVLSDGVDEFHIHLMAETTQARRDLIEDVLALARH